MAILIKFNNVSSYSCDDGKEICQKVCCTFKLFSFAYLTRCCFYFLVSVVFVVAWGR